MSTFQYLWSSCSIQFLLVPTGRMVFLLMQICNSPRESSREACKQFAQQQIESCAGFVFSNTLPWHFLWVLRCFDIFSTISDVVFMADTLPTCTSPALSVSSAAPIAYQIQVLEVIGTVEHKGSGLWAKLIVCKHKQSPLPTTMNLRYKGHPLNVK